uniref:Uncharacterized protein n=1 Tax=Nelumbo nucifera TaxID=4432 RepID=A0A822Y0C0_NELNU|nr:TPA_asm: hypothetical protein HUJ06_025969 [Nelumbo nucifera]
MQMSKNVDSEVVGSKDVTVPPMVSNPCDDAVVNGFHDDKPGSCNSNDGFDGAGDSSKVDVAVDLEIEEGEDLFDPQESMSLTSNNLEMILHNRKQINPEMILLLFCSKIYQSKM